MLWLRLFMRNFDGIFSLVVMFFMLSGFTLPERQRRWWWRRQRQNMHRIQIYRYTFLFELTENYFILWNFRNNKANILEIQMIQRVCSRQECCKVQHSNEKSTQHTKSQRMLLITPIMPILLLPDPFRLFWILLFLLENFQTQERTTKRISYDIFRSQ